MFIRRLQSFKELFFWLSLSFKKGTFVDEHLIDVSSPDISCKDWISFEDIEQCSLLRFLLIII